MGWRRGARAGRVLAGLIDGGVLGEFPRLRGFASWAPDLFEAGETAGADSGKEGGTRCGERLAGMRGERLGPGVGQEGQFPGRMGEQIGGHVHRKPGVDTREWDVLGKAAGNCFDGPVLDGQENVRVYVRTGQDVAPVFVF